MQLHGKISKVFAAAAAALMFFSSSAAVLYSSAEESSMEEISSSETVSGTDGGEDDYADLDSEDEEELDEYDDEFWNSENFHRSGSWGYMLLADGTAAISRYFGTSARPGIPPELDGYTVTAISGGWFLDDNGDTLLYGNIHAVMLEEDGSVGSSRVYSPFEGNKKLKEITIPETVKYVGAISFKNCQKLENIRFMGDKVEIIGNNCFENCTSLEMIELPDSVRYIDQSAFKGCTALTTVSSSAEHFENSVYENCTSLESVSLSAADSVAQFMFAGCSSLKRVNLPEGMNSIGDNAFELCTSLESISLPDSISTISNRAFAGCTALKSAKVGYNVDTVGKGAFADCPLTSLTFSEKLTAIGDEAFGMTYDGELMPDFRLICPEGSAAHSYAVFNGLKYELTDIEPTAAVSTGSPQRQYDISESEDDYSETDRTFYLLVGILAAAGVGILIAIIAIFNSSKRKRYDEEEY